MRLSVEQSRALLEKYGCYVTEACDKCGRVLGAVRFSRHYDCGVWCSRVCRNGPEAHAPGTCWNCGASLAGLRRGTRFCSGTCRKRENRKSWTRETSRDQDLKNNDFQSEVIVRAITG